MVIAPMLIDTVVSEKEGMELFHQSCLVKSSQRTQSDLAKSRYELESHEETGYGQVRLFIIYLQLDHITVRFYSM